MIRRTRAGGRRSNWAREPFAIGVGRQRASPPASCAAPPGRPADSISAPPMNRRSSTEPPRPLVAGRQRGVLATGPEPAVQFPQPCDSDHTMPRDRRQPPPARSTTVLSLSRGGNSSPSIKSSRSRKRVRYALAPSRQSYHSSAPNASLRPTTPPAARANWSPTTRTTARAICMQLGQPSKSAAGTNRRSRVVCRSTKSTAASCSDSKIRISAARNCPRSPSDTHLSRERGAACRRSQFGCRSSREGRLERLAGPGQQALS